MTNPPGEDLMAKNKNHRPKPLITVRTAVVLILAAIVAASAAALMFVNTENHAAAGLAAGAAFLAGTRWANQIVK